MPDVTRHTPQLNPLDTKFRTAIKTLAALREGTFVSDHGRALQVEVSNGGTKFTRKLFDDCHGCGGVLQHIRRISS